MSKLNIVFAFLILGMSVGAQQTKGFTFEERNDKKQVDILYNGKLMTAYCYFDSSRKPVLFPVNTV
ncbi:MAG TPA: hypothetical protein VFU29_18865, partial [Chitinophagaceae bacterium]|nr:hypothetical protein [Chitinophagaceae bacterium]